MNIQFTKCPSGVAFDSSLLPTDLPIFLTHVPDFEAMEKLVEKYRDFKNILVVGHGGSVSSFFGIYESLKCFYKGKQLKTAHVLSTIDPDYIAFLKSELSADDTLVVAISKSGQDTTQLEALSQFDGYSTLVITEANTPLYQIAQKKGWEIYLHPAIGGRFTGLTEVALLPALLCGLDAKAFFSGGRSLHEKFASENPAWSLASSFYELEKKGVVDVFVPIYSHYLTKFSWLIIQLAHESFGKDGKGQTFVCLEGPEWQHHTLQRVLAGRKNVAVVTVGVKSFQHDYSSDFSEFGEVIMRGQPLATISDIHLKDSLEIEQQCLVKSSLPLNQVPCVEVQVSSIDEQNVGEFVAFWQMVAVYSALLRQVDPFDQPAVEAGKSESFQTRVH